MCWEWRELGFIHAHVSVGIRDMSDISRIAGGMLGTFRPLWNLFEAFLSVVVGLEGFEGMVIGWRKGVG